MGGLLVVRVWGDCRQFGRPERIHCRQRWPRQPWPHGHRRLDDWRQPDRRTNTGLSPRGKLLLQALAAALFLLVQPGNRLDFPQCGLAVRPRPVARLLLILGTARPVRVSGRKQRQPSLTDGLDWLAAGCGAWCSAGFGDAVDAAGPSGRSALAGFCAAMAVAPGWGILAHNASRPGCSWMTTGSLHGGGP